MKTKTAAQADKSNPYPPTPELDKMRTVTDKSQVVGEFIDVFLTEKNIALCTYQTAGNNGEPKYRWKKGVKIAKLDRRPTDREPRFEDVFNQDAEHNPDHVSWGEGYIAVHTRIEKLLAEFFAIDLKKAEAERTAILKHLQNKSQNATSS